MKFDYKGNVSLFSSLYQCGKETTARQLAKSESKMILASISIQVLAILVS